MAKILSVRLSDQFHSELRQHAERRGLELSVAARDLLRRGLGAVSDEFSAGWAEGAIAAKREFLRRVHRVVIDDDWIDGGPASDS